MKYNIVITEPAKKGIHDAISYITKELKNKQAALDLFESINTAVNSLSVFPERYAVVNDESLAIKQIRMMSVKNYLIFYIVHKDEKIVVIEQFLYARRDWLNILK